MVWRPLGFCIWLIIASPAIATAQTSWVFSTEYPASNISGIGLSTFAVRLAEHSAHAIAVDVVFDAANGLNSLQMIAAAQDGRITGGDAFAGTLDVLDPVLALPSLPFVAASTAEAKRLNDTARPLYRKALASHGAKLLYITIWPATGLWSDRPLETPDDLKALSVRTYDANSARTMENAGARAQSLPFNAAMAKLKAHEINAILSSGDGGAGRRLWDDLHVFAAIGYATPISIAFMRQSTFDALSPPLRDAVEAAARETEAAQFALVADRTEANYAQMRAHGVTIQLDIPKPVHDALAQASRPVVESWANAASPEARALLP
jgi:TRAP-type C4-dicarboxylate transport system substrate-binding protein